MNKRTPVLTVVVVLVGALLILTSLIFVGVQWVSTDKEIYTQKEDVLSTTGLGFSDAFVMTQGFIEKLLKVEEYPAICGR